MDDERVQVPDGVIDSTLFALSMAVVIEMDAVTESYLAQDGYHWVAQRDTRVVKTYESGWPNIGLKEKVEGSVAHGRLWAEKVNNLRPLAFEKLESMPALISYVEGAPELVERMHPPTLGNEAQDKFGDMLFRHFVQDLPASIYDRAKALGVAIDPDDPDLVDLYLQREKSWLAPELPYQLVVPLLLTNFDIDDAGFQVDSATRIEHLTDQHLVRMCENYSNEVPSPLADAVRYALVVDMPPLQNPGEGRMFDSPDPPLDTTAIDAVCEALRIVSATRTGWARVYRRPIGWARHWEDDLPNLNHIHTARRYPADFDKHGWLKTNAAITADEVAALPAVVAALKGANEQAKLASRRLSMAQVRDIPDDQVIDACIGLEALLGQLNAELSYRVAVRASALLANSKEFPVNPEFVFNMTRAVYTRRSELVHGSTKGKTVTFKAPEGTNYSISSVAILLLRMVLKERLLLPPDWEVTELDKLVLQRLAPPPPTPAGPTYDVDRA